MTVTGTLTWLGGGRSTDVHEGFERSGYLVTGLGVTLFALVTGIVTSTALIAADWSLAPSVALALVAALVAGTTGRALAARGPDRTPDRLGLGARIAVAVFAGVLVGELAGTALFGGAVDRALDDKAQRGVASAPGVLAANTELDAARAARADVDRAVTSAQADIDRALVIARCEFNPTPECPQTRITGVPGRGPEAQTANAMLEDARGQLAAAQNRVAAADQRVADDEKAVSRARSAAYADADRGLGARWLAMHEETTDSAGALLLRLLTLAGFVLLALLPLILRWWRGETSLDRRTAYLAVAERAEIDADTAIARKRAEVRAEAEAMRAEQELTSARLAVEADTAIDRERQRTRIIAAIGGIEFGITEPRRNAELPAPDREDSTVSEHPPVTPHLPAAVGSDALVPAASRPAPVPAPTGGLELPIIGQVPFTDTAARWIRPLVPSFVANAIDTATHPLRTARQVFEEAEEITFTLRRTRKVTIETQDPHHPADGYRMAPGPHESWHARQVAATVVDSDYAAVPSGQPEGYGLAPGDRRDELDARGRAELGGKRGPRELPPGN